MRTAIIVLGSLLLAATPAAAFNDGGFAPGMPYDSTAGAGLIDSMYSLTDLDATTGIFLGDISFTAQQHLVVAELFDANAFAFDIERLTTSARAEADQRRRVVQDRIAAEARAKSANSQTEVAPDGCPTSVPPKTLRGGAEDVGAYEICVASVATAATPAAAESVKFVFQNLGVPYSQNDRMGANAFDCSSFVMRAYDSAGVNVLANGWAPTTHTLAPYSGYSSYPWLRTISYDDALPGDLLLRPPSETRTDGGGHVAMLLADGFMVHTASFGDVSHVTRAYKEDDLYNVRRVGQ